MTRKPKPIIAHTDRLGREIFTGDCIAYPAGNSLEIGIVVKLNIKMVRIQPIKTTHSWYSNEHNKYPDDVVKLDGPDVTFYLLQNQSSARAKV